MERMCFCLHHAGGFLNAKGACIMERVAAVVVTYNRKELLAQCIKALLGQQNAVCDILIVDNASTDGTGAYWPP